jgi:hypothetical protein
MYQHCSNYCISCTNTEQNYIQQSSVKDNSYVDEITGDDQCELWNNLNSYKKNGNTVGQCISYSQISRKLMSQLEGRLCVLSPLSLVSQWNNTAVFTWNLQHKSREANICLIHFLLRMVWNKDCFITIALQLCFRICHYECSRKPGGVEIEWDISAVVYADNNLLCENINTKYKNTEA